MADEHDAPSLLILGGHGFIGRHFLKYVLDYDLAGRIRIVDKRPMVMCDMTPEFAKLYSNPKVEFVQANLSMEAHADKAFAPSAHCPTPFQLVVNLAAETQYGLNESTYEERITQIADNVAKRSAAAGVDRFIHVSTAEVYAGTSSKPAKETDALSKAWTVIGQAHVKAEAAVAKVPNLSYCILRLPIVYGPGDLRGLMPRVAVASTYAYTRQKMELLWGENLRLHTVHVQDVAACLWHLLCAGTPSEAYNLVDKGDTSQGKLAAVFQQVFPGLQTGYYNAVTSTLATAAGLEELLEDANSGHLAPWNEMCAKSNVKVTPVQPLLEKELLLSNHIAVDGSKLTAAGFEVSCPEVTPDLIKASIQYWEQLGKFPRLS